MLVEQGGGEIKILDNNLKKFVGNPVFNTERIYEETPPGVSTGLAWTSMGMLERMFCLKISSPHCINKFFLVRPLQRFQIFSSNIAT